MNIVIWYTYVRSKHELNRLTNIICIQQAPSQPDMPLKTTEMLVEFHSEFQASLEKRINNYPPSITVILEPLIYKPFALVSLWKNGSRINWNIVLQTPPEKCDQKCTHVISTLHSFLSGIISNRISLVEFEEGRSLWSVGCH